MLLGAFACSLGPDGSLALPERFLREAAEPCVYARLPREEGPLIALAFSRAAFSPLEEPEESGDAPFEPETVVLPLRNGSVALPPETARAAGDAALTLVGVQRWAELWRAADWDREAERLAEEVTGGAWPGVIV